MNDAKKSKAQLIEELRNLRQQCALAQQTPLQDDSSTPLYRNIIELANDAIITINRDGIIITYNRKAEEMFGYRAEEMLGKSSADLIPREKRDEEQAIIKKHVMHKPKGLLRTLREGFALCKNGEMLPVEASYYGFHLNGEYLMTGIIRDISARKLAEKALEESREYSDNIIESSLDAIVISDIHGYITRVNSAFLKLVGIDTKEQIIGQGIKTLAPPAVGDYESTTGERVHIGPNFFEDLYRSMAELMSGQKIAFIQGYHLRADKKIVPVEDTISHIYDKHGTRIGTMGIIRDITAKKKAENELRNSRDFLERLFRTAQEGILVGDTQGYIMMVNDAAAAMLGYSKDELIGKHPAALFTSPQEKERARKTIQEFLTRGVLTGVERSWRRRDGSPIDIEMNMSIIKDPQGNITGAVSSIRDITARKQAEKTLRASEERYRRIFENTFIAMQEEDISPVISALNELKASGVNNFRQYFDEHPEFVRQATRMTTILDVNEAFLKLYGAHTREELYQARDNVLREEALYPYREALVAFAEGKAFFQSESVHYTLQDEPKNILLQINFLVKQRDVNRVLLSVVDITPLKSAERQLIEYQQHLQSLANQLTSKEEEMRHSLATYLHDRIGQTLSVLKIRLEMMSSAVTIDDYQKTSREALKLIESVIQEVRSLSYELSPVILHVFGLEAALVSLVEQMQEEHKLKITFRADKKAAALDKALEIFFYRAVRELLFNVLKHARARKATVSMRHQDGTLRITVADNGIGFDPVSVSQLPAGQGGFGLFSIKERLNHFGGTMDMKSAMHKGTTITISVPLA